MNSLKLAASVAFCVAVIATSTNAMTQTNVDQCAAYAREATQATPTTTGAARGALRGALAGGLLFGRPGYGAAAGAIIGGTRRGVQKNRSYQFYFNECMARW